MWDLCGQAPPGHGRSAPPSPHRTDYCRSIRWREGVKGDFACTLTGHFTNTRRPAVTAALDAVPGAYHNPAAVWWGFFAPAPFTSWVRSSTSRRAGSSREAGLGVPQAASSTLDFVVSPGVIG